MRRKIDRACSKRTICEVHRQLYDLIIVKVDDPDVRAQMKMLIEEAFVMGIKLCQRLIDRKAKMLEWERCDNAAEINALRQERIRLEKEILDATAD